MKANRLTFPKSKKLCSLSAISDVFRKGEIIYHFPYKVFYLSNNLAYSRSLVSVPKKSFKRAVDRNRIKRVTREALRICSFSSAITKGVDICLIYTSKELPDSSTINKKIKDVLEKINTAYKVHSDTTADINN